MRRRLGPVWSTDGMSGPRARRSWSARLAGLGLVVVLGTGCTQSPKIASGNLAAAKLHILTLVNQTGVALGTTAEFTPARTADALPCYKKAFGYTVKHLDANQAEVPLPIKVNGDGTGAALLSRVERYWRSRGYTIDRSGMSDKHYPKLRAHAGDNLLVATGYVTLPQINLYGVTPCVRS